ncbi:MAG: alpha/beta hydrolase [Planctomycetota bacterium]|nr:alpha/beta hydrolase [Planctomycetota bacterium]MDP6988282.1 alpha/beta hydrolase [Planctomycetota bacterium]
MSTDTPQAPPVLRGGRGERLDFAFTPGAGDGSAVVVLGHGVTSAHDRPYLVALAEALGAAGLSCLRFSFAGNGASEGAFVDATISSEVADLGCVLDALAGRRAAYVGHSMGAAVGLLRAVEDPRIAALVSLAGMVRVEAFFERHFGRLVCGRDFLLDRSDCPYDRALRDDALAQGDLVGTAARVRVPWLLVHGTADELVEADDTTAASAACPGHAETVLLAGADHRFSGRLDELCGTVVPWLVRALDVGGARRGGS